MRIRISTLSCALLLLLAHCERNDQPLSDATGIFEKAVSFFEDRAYLQAESLFVRSLPVFVQSGQTYTVVEVNRYLGQICLAEGRFYTALGKFESALALAESLKDFRTEMRLRGLIGDTYSSLATYQDAFLSYRESHRLCSAFNDLDMKASLEMRMAEVSVYTDHLDDAFAYYQAAYSYYQNQGGVLAAEALGGLGEVLYRQKKLDAAENSLNQARSMIQKGSEFVLDARLRMQTGVVLKAQGRNNEALQTFRDAANNLRSKKTGRNEEIQLLFNIGTVYFDNGRFVDSKKYFTEAEGLARSMGDGIAEGYLALFGAKCEERSLPANQRLQDVDQLVQQYLTVAQKFQAGGHRSGEAYAHAQMGQMYESVGNLAKARDEYRQAIEVEETTLGEFLVPKYHHQYQEMLNLDKERSGWYAQLASLLIQMKGKEEALSVLELGSQRTQTKLLQDVSIAIRHPNLKQDLLKARSNIRELRMLQIEQSSMLSIRRGTNDDRYVNALHNQISNLQRESAAQSERIIGQYPNYEPLLHTSSIKIKEIQASIPPGTLVVRFLPANDQLHVFALTKTKFEVKSTIVPREKLISLVSEYRRLLHDPSVYAGSSGETSVSTMTRFATLSTQLYDYLLRPVDGMLERNLVVIESPEFEGFPFHTIERQDRGGSVKYVIEITSVDYLPSLSAIRFKTADTERIGRVTAMGDPTGKNWSIDYELRDIRSFFKEANILISRDASWDNLKEVKADVLQLSTDFLMGEGVSPLGMVALSKEQTPDDVSKIPFERLAEIQAPSIVVLSNQYGQGFGLSTIHALALRINGTSDVFFNSWFSDRKAAKFFSEFFYTHLANGLAPGDAYRQALLNLIRTRDVSHPHSWGQFFHFGLG
jgi:tetratricopeptide (TPR) repeat protein